MDWRPQASINLTALQHNLTQVRQHAPGQRIIAVIKADAYGHGLVPVAQSLQGQVDMFAVARLHEAITLREAGIAADILLLEGVHDQEELTLAIRHTLQPVVHQASQVALLQCMRPDRTIYCWLKINTGMHRLGIAPSEVNTTLQQIRCCQHIRLCGLMTHLANADDPADTSVRQQMDQMIMLGKQHPLPQTIANSAGILHWPASHADWVRPGLMLYGAAPHPTRPGSAYDLQPVMTLTAPLLGIRQVQAGERVGYNGLWEAHKTHQIGIVGIGYGDGYPRNITADAYVIVNQQPARIVGRISMDMLTIDLTDIPAQRGDQVVLWGTELPINQVATWAQTVPYTLFTGVTARVLRHYQ
ncbi:MAG: alanine racemase [Pseudomonadota bacterium]